MAELNFISIQICAAVALFCSMWNLFGDLCFTDFALAYMDMNGAFGAINTSESRPGNLFDFSQDWPVRLAQAGGWMYPIWAIVTIYPLYLGLESSVGTISQSWSQNSVFPCALLAYGLCVVGGNLHSGFAFATILPQIFHQNMAQTDDETQLEALQSTIKSAQAKIMDCYVFGYTPGPLAIMISSTWIIYIVITKETNFPNWFALCTPPVTLVWVSLIGFLLMPWPWGMYFVGSFGTWIIFVMNIAASLILWNVNAEISLRIKSRIPYMNID